MKRIPILLFLLIFPIHACLWDYDTLAIERRRFPNTLELITGKFLRHSPEFYQWRIKDRLEKLKNQPDQLSYYDDLAVAYEKTGQTQKAIETMLAKEIKKPGLYETYANLGTFYIHNKQYQEGIKYIDKAIAINPDAHFGREIYQKYLVEYILTRIKDNKIQFPLAESKDKNYPINFTDPKARIHFGTLRGFDNFLEEKQKQKFSRKAALKGIQGMMRFGNYDSPVLLEVLGHLLLGTHPKNRDDAKRLAARAFLQASYQTKDKKNKTIYRNLARSALLMQTQKSYNQNALTLEELEKDFSVELAEGKKWQTQIAQDEKNWIQANKNPEKEFTKKYYQQPTINSAKKEPLLERTLGSRNDTRIFKILALFLTLLLLYYFYDLYKRHKQKNKT